MARSTYAHTCARDWCPTHCPRAFRRAENPSATPGSGSTCACLVVVVVVCFDPQCGGLGVRASSEMHAAPVLLGGAWSARPLASAARGSVLPSMLVPQCTRAAWCMLVAVLWMLVGAYYNYAYSMVDALTHVVCMLFTMAGDCAICMVPGAAHARIPSTR
jgi:hypothetical protein